MCQSKQQGGKRCATHLAHAAATALIPRRGDLRSYYAATDAKHFTVGTPGSTFTDPSLRRLNDVVALACRQRGNLFGDDRDALIALGAPDAAFRPGVRYLLVRTPGTVGVQHSAGLPDTTSIGVVRTKPGAPCSLVLTVERSPTTEVGTIIIGRADDTSPDAPEIVFTAHPGIPTPYNATDPFADQEGRTISLGTVRRVYDGEVWLNTRLASEQGPPRR